MKIENVKVGATYTLKVGRNLVAVKAMSVDAKGKITVSPASGKMMTVADAGRLTMRTVVDDPRMVAGKKSDPYLDSLPPERRKIALEARAASVRAPKDAPKTGKPCGKCLNCRNGAPQLCQGAPVARPKASTPKATKSARGPNVGQQGAPEAKEKRVGLVDAAILVLHDAGNKPMNVKEIVETILARKLWTTSGKTPAATLYSSILREIQKKGNEARFKKADRGLFALAD
jgi:hypothetical protein